MQLHEATASRFLPKPVNSGMVKWLRFGYSALSWLFPPKIINNSLVTVKAETENGIKYIHILGKFLFLHTYRRQANFFTEDITNFGDKMKKVASPRLLQASNEWNWSFRVPCAGLAALGLLGWGRCCHRQN